MNVGLSCSVCVCVWPNFVTRGSEKKRLLLHGGEVGVSVYHIYIL